MSRLPLCLFCVVCLAIPALLKAEETGANLSAAELLPPHCIAVAEMPQPTGLLKTLLDHPVWHRFQKLEEYQNAILDPKYLFFQAAVSQVETQIEMSWREAIAVLTEGGITTAFDPQHQAAAVLFRGRDSESMKTLTASLLKIARKDAERKGNANAIPERDYRGITVYGQKGGRFAIVGPWLIAVTKDELGQSILDRLLDGPKAGANLMANERFTTARNSRDKNSDLWVWADLAKLREAGPGAGLKKGQAENPAAELLVGGLLSNLRETPYVTVSLSVSAEQTRLAFSVPHDQKWIEESREYYFGPNGHGAAPALLRTPNMIFGLSTYRDISAMWLRAGDLFNEKTLDEMAKAEANLSTLFSGKDFGEDILGTLNPGMQIIVTRQNFENRMPQPAIKLPSFALVAELTKPDETWPELRRTFQSLIGFLNVIGSMQGNPQLDLTTESKDGQESVQTRFVPEAREKDSTQARIQFNFSPSVARKGNRFVLSSTTELASELVKASAADQVRIVEANGAGSGNGSEVVNTGAVLNLPVLRDALNDNRGQLVAQTMLKEGRTKEDAERRIDVLFAALQQFRDLTLKLTSSDERLQLELVAETIETSKPTDRVK